MSSDLTRLNPYVGPRAFQTGETLYGRDREQRDLLNYLLSQRVVLLYSPSGAGKTSLIHAGLIPGLQSKSFAVLPIIRLNLEPPDGSMAGTDSTGFNRYIYSALLSLEEGLPEEQQTGSDDLSRLSLADYLDRRPPQESQNDPEQPDIEVLVFDQFEEILTVDPTDSRGRAGFFDQLGEALRQRSRWVLFSMREDYIAALDPFQRAIPTHFNNRFRLDLLGVDAARLAIQRPASQAGVDFGDPAAQKLVDDLRRVQVQRPDGSMEEQLGGYVEPVQLQVVCYRLWQGISPDQSLINEEDIARTGDVDQSLGDYYAEQAAAIAAETGVRQRAIRGWFENQLITEGGIRGQVLMGTESSGGLDNRAIRRLENAHLVRAEKRRGATWFELAHDRLIAPVRRDNAAWFLAKLSPLQRQAELWEKENRPSHLLLRDLALQDAQSWAKDHPDELTQAEIDFLKESQEANLLELEAKNAQQRQLEMAQQLAEEQVKRAEEQARSARRLRWLVLGLGAVLVAAIALAFLATRAQRSATRSANEAAIQASTATYALGQVEIQAATATYALGVSQVEGTRAAKNAATAQAASTRAVLEANSAETARVEAENQKITAEANEQRVKEQAEQVLNSFSSQLAAQGDKFLQDKGGLSQAALLAVEAFRTYDTAAARSLLLKTLAKSQEYKITTKVIPEGQQNKITSLAVHPSGDLFAYGLGNGDIVLWSVSKDQREDVIPHPRADTSNVTALSFSQIPGSSFLAAGNANGYVHLYDLEGNRPFFRFLHSPSNRNAPIADLAFHPTENWLAVPLARGVDVFDINEIWGSTAAHFPRVRIFPKNSGNATSIAWSPDGTYLLVGDDQESVQVWDRGLIEKPIIGPFKEHLGDVSSVAWSPGGEKFASSSINDFSDTQIIVWRFPSGEKETNFKLQERGVEAKSLSFNPDGQILAVGNYEGKVLFWNTNDWSKIGEILIEYEGPDPVKNNDITEISFLPLPGQNMLAVAQSGGNIGLVKVNLQQGLTENVAKDLGGDVLAIYALPDGSLLAAVQTESGVQVVRIDPDGNQSSLADINQPATSAAFSPDGARLALGDEEFASTTIYETENGGEVEQVVFSDSPAQVLGLAFKNDGVYLAGSLCMGSVSESRECNAEALIRVIPVDGSTSTDYTLETPDGFTPYSLAFAPGRMTLASGSGEKTLIWDVPDGTFSEFITGPSDALAYHPDGGILAYGDPDAQLQLLDASSGQPASPALTGSPARFSSLAYDATGDRLYAGLENGTIQVWEMAPGVWLDLVCDIAGRPLTQQEWNEYFPNQEYQPYCK